VEACTREAEEEDSESEQEKTTELAATLVSLCFGWFCGRRHGAYSGRLLTR
jgi:hypothetical protein